MCSHCYHSKAAFTLDLKLRAQTAILGSLRCGVDKAFIQSHMRVALNVACMDPCGCTKGVLNVPRGYKTNRRTCTLYSSFVNIPCISSCNPSWISIFRPIGNYNEVGNVQEVQMNISSNICELNCDPKFVRELNGNPMLSKIDSPISSMACCMSNLNFD